MQSLPEFQLVTQASAMEVGPEFTKKARPSWSGFLFLRFLWSQSFI
jgi:hypothetical protein